MNNISRSGDFGSPEHDGNRMYRRWRDRGEDIFVSELLARGDGNEMYKALMRIPHWSMKARDALLAGIVASKDPDGLTLAYEYYRGMPKKVRGAFVDAAIESRNPRIAYHFLGSKHRLPMAKRKVLLKIVASDEFYAECTREFSRQITEDERAELGKT